MNQAQEPKVIDHTQVVKKYGGKWVVFDDSRETVVAAADTLIEAIALFRKKFGDVPMGSVFKVPTKIVPYVGGATA